MTEDAADAVAALLRRRAEEDEGDDDGEDRGEGEKTALEMARETVDGGEFGGAGGSR